MSALAGLYNFDGAPIDDKTMAALDKGLIARGPDGAGRVTSGSVAMVYRAFHTNCQSRLETQPMTSTSGHIICWDGRLDNRDELISTMQYELQGDHTDVAIVLAAYLKWGIDFLPKIIGDFALSIWNPLSATLILSRDMIGPRTLYYHGDDRRVIWSTDLRSLLDIAKVSLEINDEYVAGFLTNLPEPGLTPYKGFEGVPPAHAVVIRGRQVQVRRFWGLDPHEEIRYRTDAEYEDHFRHLFREGVACRLRADRPVWSELSGGMDSSSVVCMAHDIIKDGSVDTPGLETVSLVYDEASKSDERKYIVPVEKKIGKTGLHLREDDHRILTPWGSDYVPSIPCFAANFSAYYKALNQAMRNAGARVLLAGKGGDEVLSGDGDPFPELADLLVQGKPVTLHRRIRAWSRASKQDYFPFLWRKVIVPLLPGRLQVRRNRMFDTVLRFFNREFARRMDFRSRLFGPPDLFGFARPGRRYQSKSFLYAPRELSAGFWQELCDVEFSYPFTHRPLVEFMLAIPVEQKARPGERKSLLRRALRDILPAEIAGRGEGRITIWDAAVRAAAREGPRIHRLFRAANGSVYKYLDSDAILAAFDESGQQSNVHVISLVPFEYWLRSVEHRLAGSSSVRMAQ